MTHFEALKRDLLEECEDDHVGLWAVIGYIEDEMPQASELDIREATLRLLHELLAAGQVQAGFPDSNGRDFHPWPFPADAINDRIKSLWQPGGRRPGPGEIVWFTTPAKSSAPT